MLKDLKGLTCKLCGLRPAEIWWGHSEEAFYRGGLVPACERCCVERQLAFAREAASRIPELEKQWAALTEAGREAASE